MTNLTKRAVYIETRKYLEAQQKALEPMLQQIRSDTYTEPNCDTESDVAAIFVALVDVLQLQDMETISVLDKCCEFLERAPSVSVQRTAVVTAFFERVGHMVIDELDRRMSN